MSTKCSGETSINCMCWLGLHFVSLSGHLGAKVHPSILSIKLGGSPSKDLSFYLSPLIEGVESRRA